MSWKTIKLYLTIGVFILVCCNYSEENQLHWFGALVLVFVHLGAQLQKYDE